MKPICRILTAALFSLAVQGVCAEVKTLTDVRGREVRVDVPAKRVVLGFYYPDYIAVSGVDKFDNVVGISREFWEKFNSGSWSLYRAKIPSLQNIGDIGNVNAGTFSFEKTLAMKPDVVVLADWQYDVLKEEMPRFEKAGIRWLWSISMRKRSNAIPPVPNFSAKSPYAGACRADCRRIRPRHSRHSKTRGRSGQAQAENLYRVRRQGSCRT